MQLERKISWLRQAKRAKTAMLRSISGHKDSGYVFQNFLKCLCMNSIQNIGAFFLSDEIGVSELSGALEGESFTQVPEGKTGNTSHTRYLLVGQEYQEPWLTSMWHTSRLQLVRNMWYSYQVRIRVMPLKPVN